MDVLVPGPRDVRGTLSEPDAEVDRAVAACPPHPQFGGNRSDRRLRAVADELLDRGIACLRFDYGDWDGGRGERADAERAVEWLRGRYDRVGLFGYSFGGAVAVLAGAALDPPPTAVATLAPASRLGDADDLDAAAAVDRLGCPLQVVYGERDATADPVPLADRARDRGHDVRVVSADHHFVGQTRSVAATAAAFLDDHS
jgi:hypothetical protein